MTLLRGLVVGLLFAIAVPATASGQAVTRGSSLAPPNNTGFGCESTIQQDFNSGLFLAAPMAGQQSCTWWSSGIASTVGDPNTGYVLATGVVTNVRVKSGPNPAPLRIVQLRSTAGCCVGVRETAPFQPTPNGVTQVTVNWPVEVVRDSVVGVSTNDIIGFTSIANAGTLPISDQGPATHSASAALTPGVHIGTMTAPKVTPGTAIAVNYRAAIGYEPLLQYDFVPCAVTNRPVARAAQCPGQPTPPPVPVAPGQPTPVAAVPVAVGVPTLRAQAARVAAGRALVQLACGANAVCQGRLELLSRGARASARRTVAYGKASYRVAAGRRATLKVKLNTRGKRLLRRRTSAVVALRLTPKGGTPSVRRLTLRRR